MAGRDGPGTVARPGPLVTRFGTIEVPARAALRTFSGPRMAWLAPDEPTVVGCGESATIEAAGPRRIESIRAQAEPLFDAIEAAGDGEPPPDARPRLLGGFSFHDEHEPAEPWRGFPAAQFVLPRVQVAEAGDETWLAVTVTGDESADRAFEAAANRLREAPMAGSPSPGITDVSRRPNRATWREQVRAAVDRIATGDLEKVVLAQTLTARIQGAFRLADALDRLSGSYPDCYRFAVDPGLGSAFFGATPERLVSRRGDRVETDAIAGSIGRGGTDAEDRRLAEILAGSDRIRHEHAVVVEAIREQLSAVADSVTVGERTVRKLTNVQHLDTPVSARLADRTHVLELVGALHPTPSVGGRPPAAAQRFIADTEPFDRGWYAAPVGWFDAEGDGTFAVGIRSAVATPDRATLFAGNGIVADSDPDDEWDELQLKYRPILDLLR